MKEPAKQLGWHAIGVEPALGEPLAAQLLHDAGEPSTWSLENLGASVTRVAGEGEERFYFSPRAAAIFEKVIASCAGKPCDPPLAKTFPPARSSRLLLGFKSRWEPFQPPRLVSKPQGVPSAARPNDASGDVANRSP